MSDAAAARVCVYVGEALERYSFGDGHPFGPDRLPAFWAEARRRGLDARVTLHEPVQASRADLERFHDRAYLDRVMRLSERGVGFLDQGDTPVFRGIYEAAAGVVGTTVDACRRLMAGECRRAFIPIAGLHHGARNRAAGFCALNDCGVAIEVLEHEYGLERIAYVDIDAHHGDGVYYAFEDDPALAVVDLHEDGRYLYPGSGAAHERGTGTAAGTKLNIPMPPDTGDEMFMKVWPRVERFVDAARPQFILFQCGADGLAGDPLTHLRYTPAAHRHATASLCRLAERHAAGRLLAMGGGGYNRRNLALAWSSVLETLLDAGAGD
ncbi:MAG: acetoin utilization protein AcuC [Gammaproteobacteria bacterium]|nr:acetoin utilization protein AcuC [Gammaproteobacteria bacterium]